MAWWERLLSTVITFTALAILLIFSILYNFMDLYGKMPSIERIESKIPLPSYVYTSDGVLMRKYFSENRSPVKYEDIPENVINCLIATEDVRFYEHSGIDFTAVFSAIWANLKGERRGASTITQQLAKNLFKTRRTTSGHLSKIAGLRVVNYKLKEWITAVRLELKYSKKEILTHYLNTVDFGSNSFGLKTAARNFFSVSPHELSLTQAATLIGALKATTYYNPLTNPDNALERRNVVLKQLVRYNKLSEKMYERWASQPLAPNPYKPEQSTGVAPHFERGLTKFLRKWCRENGYNLYTDGLEIRTTINARLQNVAEQTLAKHMRYMQGVFDRHWRYQQPWDNYRPAAGKDQYIIDLLKQSNSYAPIFKKHHDKVARAYMQRPKPMRIFTWEGSKDTLMSPIDSLKYHLQILQAGLITVNPRNGHILTWVGSIDYEHFSYDHVLQAKRQPGSTFKPMVYAEALERGQGPCDRALDAPITIIYEEDGEQKSWSPNNSDYRYSYRNITLRKALATSKNTVTARLTEELSPEAVKARAQKMGITSPLKAVPSIGLGANVVSLFELVGAYTPIMNEGKHCALQYVVEIKDRKGRVLYKAQPEETPAISAETAFLMQYMLKGGIEEQDGTSQALFEYPDLFKEQNEIGGKTGTSSNYADGWYIGLTKDLITGIWIGADDQRIRFRDPEIGEASQTALPLYGKYMTELYNTPELGVSRGKFPPPKVEINKRHNCLTPYISKVKKKEEDSEESSE